MTRSTKSRDKMNRKLFEVFQKRMIGFEKEADNNFSPIQKIKLDESDKNWCQNVDIISTLVLLPRVSTALFTFNEDKFLTISGLNNLTEYDNDHLNQTTLNAGLFLTMVNELNIPLKKGVTQYEIYENILSQHEDQYYDGHELSDLESYLEKITIFKINSDSVLYNASLEHIMTYILSENPQELIIEFSPDLLNQFRRIVFTIKEDLPYHYLCKSLLSVDWKDSFIESYKCIEFVFHLQALSEIFKKASSDLSIHEFSALLDTELGWRPKEEEALKGVFSKIDEKPKELIKMVKSSDEESMKDYKWFYRIRNSLVHSRPSTQQIQYTNEKWDFLLQATLHIIEQWHLSE